MALSDDDVAKIVRAVAVDLGLGWAVQWQDLDNPGRVRRAPAGVIDAWHAASGGDKLVNSLDRARDAAELAAAKTVVVDEAAATVIAERVVGHLGDTVAKLVADELAKRLGS